jgi:diacylglycerol kinase (ATP)
MKPRALVVLNPAARHGTALHRFEAVSPLLRDRYELTVVLSDLDGRWRDVMVSEVQSGIPAVIAAGGDGTVSAVASVLLSCGNGWGTALGAVGLGSSNDFHKPFGLVHAGIPLRIDLARARPRDAGRARFSRNGEPASERMFLVSASLGVTARANALINRGRDAVLGLLKRRFVDGAVVYAALAALVRHSDVRARLSVDGDETPCAISNLSVLKTPFLSGCLRFDTPVAPDSGLLAANLCHDMGRAALVATLLGLARGRFRGRPRTRHWMARNVGVELRAPTPLELDGEVTEARHVLFDVLLRRIITCA